MSTLLRTRPAKLAAIAAVVAAVASGCGGSGSGGSSGSRDSITIGDSTTLSGPLAQVGVTGLQGVSLAVNDLNAKGGVLGKNVKLVTADDGDTPATGASQVRSMITSAGAKAIFGPVSGAVAAAQLPVAERASVPSFYYSSNDLSLMRGGNNTYAFQFGPNSAMEQNAVADDLAKQAHGRQITIATFAPDDSFGRQTVTGLGQALKRMHVNYRLVAQQSPPASATNLRAYLTAISKAHPDYVFNAQVGADLVNFTKQASSAGLFRKTKVIAMYDYDVLKSLGSNAPAGAIGFDRAPFWAMPGLASFVSHFKATYHDYPSEWAVMGYTAVQGWAWAAEKAKSFNASDIAQTLAGATVPTIRGDITIQASDHQAQVPEYLGTVAARPTAPYGIPLYDKPVFVAPFSDINRT